MGNQNINCCNVKPPNSELAFNENAPTEHVDTDQNELMSLGNAGRLKQ